MPHDAAAAFRHQLDAGGIGHAFLGGQQRGFGAGAVEPPVAGERLLVGIEQPELLDQRVAVMRAGKADAMTHAAILPRPYCSYAKLTAQRPSPSATTSNW